MLRSGATTPKKDRLTTSEPKLLKKTNRFDQNVYYVLPSSSFLPALNNKGKQKNDSNEIQGPTFQKKTATTKNR